MRGCGAEMNKTQLKTWEAARAELRKAAGDAVCAEFDRHLAEGRKVSAITLLRAHGIGLETDG